MASLKARLKLNFYASSAGMAIRLVDRLALVPVLLIFWGPEYFGYWAVLTALPAILANSNLGVGNAAAVRIVYLLTDNKPHEANRLLFTAFITLSVIFGVLIAGLVVFPVDEWLLGESVITHGNYVIALMMTPMVFGTISHALTGYWTYKEKIATSIIMGNAAMFGTFVVSLAVVALGGVALHVAIGTFAVWSIWFVVYWSVSLRRFVGFSHFRFNRSELPLLFGKGMGFQLSSVWQAILFQGSTLLAHSLFGPVGAGAWATVRMLSRTGNQALELIGQAILPELQNSIAKQELVEARKLHRFGFAAGGLAGVVGALLLGSLGPVVYRFWTAEEIAVSVLAWPVMAIGMVLATVWVTSLPVHRAYNDPWAANLVGVGSAVAALLVSYALADAVAPMVAMAIGFAVFDLVMALFVVRKSLRLLADNPSDFARNLRPSLVHFRRWRAS
jgi:O-antigen/teichoic acid export membrane protein